MTQPAPQHERRRNHRVNFRSPCRVGVGGVEVRAESMNLSLGGVLARVHMADAIRLRERDLCRFELPIPSADARRIEIMARVARKHSNFVALEFQSMSVESLTELKNFVATNAGEGFDYAGELRSLAQRRAETV